ncbi:MAG: hypothetical protein H6R25_3172 [Proteobacteria bacterium]|nr:hypothetical protein [Pseudomonadota bacterium]
MAHYRKMLFALCFSLLMVAVVVGYYLWHRHYIQPFLCKVSFIQHHSDETLYLWLNYTVDGNNGILSMNGRVKSDPTKTLDRKIFFQVERKDRIYHLKSVRNMKFPDDNVSDSWLEKYEPLFFIYSNESIYIRIKKQDNHNYLFIFGTLPTYVCHASKTER